MGRFKKRPHGYAPALEYYLRSEPEGGSLRQPGELRVHGSADARRDCLVLVHGYNNHEGEAAAAYLGFRRSQNVLFKDVLPNAWDQRLGDAFWPGDADWWGPLDWLDFLVYPFAVGTAKQTAPELAALLWRLPNLERVDFVAHSLGCRLTLETVLLLHRRGFPTIGRICLMAAAVPCEMLEPGGRFEGLLRELHAANVQLHVLHSKGDSVLRFAFPPGQIAAGEPTLRALGLEGPPIDMPGRGANVSNQRISGAGHSDYWGHRTNRSVEQATREAGLFLKLGEHSREISTREVGDKREIGTERSL